MVTDLRDDPRMFLHPSDIYIWEAPKHLPHDRVIWRAKGNVRGNFPGFERGSGEIVDADIQLTQNMLAVVSDRAAFGIPSGAIERVALEASDELSKTSVLTVDFTDGLGQLRRLWLLIKRRQRLGSPRRRTGLVGGFAHAGVRERQDTQVVSGVTRMTTPLPNRRHPIGGSKLTCRVMVSLASGDYPADLIAYSNHLEIRCFGMILALPYADVLALVARESTSMDLHATYLVFTDDDVLLSLKIGIPVAAGNERASAAETLAFLEANKIPRYDAGDLHAYFAQSGDFGSSKVSRPTLVYSDSELASLPVENNSRRDVSRRCSDATESAAWKSALGSDRWSPSRARNHETTWAAEKTNLYQQLLQHAAHGFQLSATLHDQGLLTDVEFARRRDATIDELQHTHKLIQSRLLFDAGLITATEYERIRRRAILTFSRASVTTHGG